MQANDGDRERAQKAEALANQQRELERLGYRRLGPNLWHYRGDGRVPGPVLALTAKLALVARTPMQETQ